MKEELTDFTAKINGKSYGSPIGKYEFEVENGGVGMSSKRKKGNYHLLILLGILLGVFFVSISVYARDGTLGYGESFSVKTKPGQWAWCGEQLYCENTLDNYLQVSVKGKLPISKIKCSWEGFRDGEEDSCTINLPRSKWKYNASSKCWTTKCKLRAVSFTFFSVYDTNKTARTVTMKIISVMHKDRIVHNYKVAAFSGKASISWKKYNQYFYVQIYRSTSAKSGYKRIATVSENAGGYTDKNVIAGKKYYYKVRRIYQSRWWYSKKIYYIKSAFTGAKSVTIPKKASSISNTSEKVIKQAYSNYVKKYKRNIRAYSIVNIGPSNKPVLLVATSSDWVQGNTYYSCSVYCYINGKVTYMDSYGGGRPLTLYKKNGQNYLGNGTSSDKTYACIKDNQFYVLGYLNSKEQYCPASVIYYKGSRKVYKTYTMSKSNYNKATKAYKYGSSVKFKKVR